MTTGSRGRIVQVTNISPSATNEQLRTLFGHIGIIEDIVVYPNEDRDENTSKVCYIRYDEAVNAEVALHLNNTVFLDRALIVLPLAGNRDTVPDEKYANLVRAPPNTAAGVLPRSAEWPLDVISMVVGRPGEQIIQTIEPRLSSMGFPLYPPLPATTDGNRIEEIRRTILVTNLDPKTSGDQVLEFFNKHTEVRCVRMAGADFDRAAYVEFTDQSSIVKAFSLMGATLHGRQIMIQHSNCAIVKPVNNLVNVEEVVKRTGSDSGIGPGSRHSRSRSRSRTPPSRTSRKTRGKSRDRRRSRSRRRKSRSRTRSRSRSRGKKRHSRSRSRDRRREREKIRSRSRGHKRSRRTRSRSVRRPSRSRSRGNHRSDRRDKEKERVSEKSYKDKDKNKERDKDRDKREVEKDRGRRDREREKDRNRGREKDERKDKPSYRQRSDKESNSRKVATSTEKVKLKEKEKEHSSEKSKKIEIEKNTVVTIDQQVSEHEEQVTNKLEDENSGTSDSESNSCVADGDIILGIDTSNLTIKNEDKPELDSHSNHSSCAGESKRLVVGVKLVGPEDMDIISPKLNYNVDNLGDNLNGNACSQSDSSSEEMEP